MDLHFVKSSRSCRANCVEVAAAPAGWVKSNASNLECVEATVTSEGCVLIIDSKDRTVPPLHCDVRLWELFVRDIKAGWYDYVPRCTSLTAATTHPEHGTICVELSDSLVRMTHNRQENHPGHRYTPEEWLAFIGDNKAGVKGGEFDLIVRDGMYHLRRALTLGTTA